MSTNKPATRMTKAEKANANLHRMGKISRKLDARRTAQGIEVGLSKRLHIAKRYMRVCGLYI